MNWLKKTRKNKKLTQCDIANACGYSQTAYCMIENGNRRPSVELAKKIAKVLEIDWTRFYDEDEANKEETK